MTTKQHKRNKYSWSAVQYTLNILSTAKWGYTVIVVDGREIRLDIFIVHHNANAYNCITIRKLTFCSVYLK